MAFQDKVVVVTGASRGIGREVAQAFAHQGAKVVLVARQELPLQELEDAMLAAGHEVIAMAGDVSDPETVRALLMEVGTAYGRVDILVNNAAIAIKKPLLEMTSQEWEELTSVNLYAMFQLTQAFLPGMIERRAGTIINMSAAVARNGYPNLAVYSATKAGVLAFSEAVAKEVRRYGIQIYSILPHGVDTELYHSMFGSADANKLLSPSRVAQDILRVAAGETGLKSGQTLEIELTL